MRATVVVVVCSVYAIAFVESCLHDQYPGKQMRIDTHGNVTNLCYISVFCRMTKSSLTMTARPFV